MNSNALFKDAVGEKELALTPLKTCSRALDPNIAVSVVVKRRDKSMPLPAIGEIAPLLPD